MFHYSFVSPLFGNSQGISLPFTILPKKAAYLLSRRNFQSCYKNAVSLNNFGITGFSGYDPPWKYQKNKVHGAAERHHPTMGIKELCALPVADLAAPDSVLFLWATFPQLPEALQLIKAWGFQYKSVAFIWLKKNKKADSWFYGMGFWTRGNAEICLLAIRGVPNGRRRISISLLFHRLRPTAKSRTRLGKKLFLLWAICPGWNFLPDNPLLAGMYGEMR